MPQLNRCAFPIPEEPFNEVIYCKNHIKHRASEPFFSSFRFKYRKANLQDKKWNLWVFHLARVQKGAGLQRRSEHLEMLTPLMSFNLSEARLKFNSGPSPNASQRVRFPAVGHRVVSSWAQVFSLCLGLALFMPEGHQELQTTEFFIKVTSWRDVPGSCCSPAHCVPSSYIT